MSGNLFDPLDPGFLDDPYAAYGRLREEDPVHWHEQHGWWVLSRHADCVRVLSDATTFASDWRRVGIDTAPEFISVQTLDPPGHTGVRRLLNGALSAQDYGVLADDVAATTGRVLDQVRPNGGFDFVSELARPVAFRAVTRLLGIDPGDDAFSDAADAVVRSMDLGLHPDAEREGLEARRSMDRLIEEWLERSDGHGVLGRVNTARTAGRHDEDFEPVLHSLRVVFFSVYESWSRFLANAMLHLLATLDRSSAIRWSDPTGADALLDELLRFDGPVQAESRAATQDVEIAGRRISKGQLVVALLGSANRDPARFERPDQIVPGRRPNPHLGFGHGIHSCPGKRFTMLSSSALMRVVFDRCPGLELAAPPVRRPDATLRGLRSLMLAA